VVSLAAAVAQANLSLVLLLAGAMAAILPAWRVARVDPMEVLWVE